VRVLDKIYPYNISLQTLDGIASHNGELELDRFDPVPLESFEEFDKLMERCTEDKKVADKLMPSTLEGAVVRISDIIAYLGKDRQDAIRAKVADESDFFNEDIGSINAEIINNLVVNIIENSYGKPYIQLAAKHFRALKKSKKDNYEKIYDHAAAHSRLDLSVKPMMADLYGQLLDDLKNGKKSSPIYTHHIDPVSRIHYKRDMDYEKNEHNRIVADYIASMTDSYFMALHAFMFPNSSYPISYRGYFDDYKSDAKEEKENV
jgi:dGTPase